jgi:hypothetical protein
VYEIKYKLLINPNGLFFLPKMSFFAYFLANVDYAQGKKSRQIFVSLNENTIKNGIRK